jgi:uncharacterized repeat protein (TIGR01451 family)
MWHLPHVSLRLAAAVAVLVLVPAWKSGSILNSAVQAQGPAPVVASTSLASTSDPAVAARLSTSYGKLPISFEVNQGQTDGSVQFLARGSGYMLFLTPGEAVLSLHAPRVNGDGGSVAGAKASQQATTPPPSTVRLQLIGANTKAEARGFDPLPGRSNYFAGSDPAKWHTDVPTYARVRYSDVYPGIDLVYYGNQEGRLEHDFVVAAGADPNVIAIGLGGSDGAVAEKDGGIALHTKAGELTLRSPVVYQTVGGERKMIAAGYVLAGNEIRFRLGSYDTSAALVIDPVLQYSAVFGGSGNDVIRGLAVDSSGNAYITGWTYSADFPVVHSIESWPGDYMGFVSKINASGTALVYSTYLGGNGSSVGGIAVDSAGRAYAVGGTQGGLPVKNAYQPTYAGGGADAFLTVLSPAGDSLVYSTYLGGRGVDYIAVNGAAVDGAYNVYITGWTDSPNFPTLHSIQTSGAIFVAKFNSVGALQYSTVFAHANAYGQAASYGIAIDALGAVYLTGHAWVGQIPVSKSAFQSSCPPGPECGFVSKISPSGASLVYSTYLASPGGTGAEGIAVDSSGNAYVAGSTATGFPVTKNAFQKAFGGGGSDGYIAKLNAGGTGLIWSTYLGGSGEDAAWTLALDQYRQVYVAGYTTSPNFPLKAPVQGYTGRPQYFVATLLGNLGSVVYYSTYLGTSADNDLWGSYGGVAVDKALNVYVMSVTTGGIQATPGALHTGTATNPGGGLDIFVSKLVIMDDIALGVSASAGTVAHGGNLTYTIAVTSKGPDFGYNVRVADALPAGTTFVSYDAGGGSCTAPVVGGTGTLNCELLRLEKGSTYTVKLTVNVNAAAGTKLSNTATSVSNMQDFVPGNNSGTLTTMVN